MTAERVKTHPHPHPAGKEESPPFPNINPANFKEGTASCFLAVELHHAKNPVAQGGEDRLNALVFGPVKFQAHHNSKTALKEEK